MTAQDQNNLPVLTYAPKQRGLLTRHARKLIVFSALVAVGFVLHRFWEPLSHQVLWVYWARQCANFQMPPHTRVVDNDPARVATVATHPNYAVRKATNGTVASFSPPAWNEFARRDSRTVRVGAYQNGSAIAFMGKRSRPDGTDRLVIVSGGATNLYRLMKESAALVIPLPSIFDSESSTWGRHYRDSGPWRPAHLHTGVADPNDPTHIVFKFTYNEDFWPATVDPVVNPRVGFIDAYLQDDDSIRLTLRMTDQLREDRARVVPALSGGPSTMPAATARNIPQTRW